MGFLKVGPEIYWKIVHIIVRRRCAAHQMSFHQNQQRPHPSSYHHRFFLANFDISGAAIIMMAKHMTFVRDIFLNQGAAQNHGVQCALHIVQ